jgi:hypothetical protein
VLAQGAILPAVVLAALVMGVPGAIGLVHRALDREAIQRRVLAEGRL